MPARTNTDDPIVRPSIKEGSSRNAADALNRAQKIVVKVGSSLLVDHDFLLRREWLQSLVDDLQSWRQDDKASKNRDIVIVTSGAVALGRRSLVLKQGRLPLEHSQAASAAGQATLIDGWARAFEPYGVHVAQLLLTLDDTENRRRYLNARQTLLSLLDLGAVPIINENDTVATEEIRYGDNDRLAAHTAQLASADLLLILSDVDGLYTADPRTSPDATRFETVDEITPEMEANATGPNRDIGIGSGGMATKLAAARIAATHGCQTVITQGHVDRPIRHLLVKGGGTLFRTPRQVVSARKAWIANRLVPKGRVIIDMRAEQLLLERNISILPAGILRVEGDFVRGDAVSICDEQGQILGQGLSGYDHRDLQVAAGKKSREIDELLGYRSRRAAIDRNDLVLNKKGK